MMSIQKLEALFCFIALFLVLAIRANKAIKLNITNKYKTYDYTRYGRSNLK